MLRLDMVGWQISTGYMRIIWGDTPGSIDLTCIRVGSKWEAVWSDRGSHGAGGKVGVRSVGDTRLNSVRWRRSIVGRVSVDGVEVGSALDESLLLRGKGREDVTEGRPEGFRVITVGPNPSEPAQVVVVDTLHGLCVGSRGAVGEDVVARVLESHWLRAFEHVLVPVVDFRVRKKGVVSAKELSPDTPALPDAVVLG